MNVSIARLIWGLSLLSLSPLVLAGHTTSTPTGLVTQVGVIGLIVLAAIVAIGVYSMKSRDRKAAPVERVVREKHTKLHAVGPEVLVSECVHQMHHANIGALLVMEGERLHGIFTERDALFRVLYAGCDPNATKVSDVMSEDPYHVGLTTRVDDAMGIISQHRIRHLPVVEEGKVVAMISSGDLTHWLIQDKIEHVQDLIDLTGKS